MGRVSDARERLMGAVSQLIWVGSYGSTTIDHICEKAGVKKGSFYYFFESKGDLALAALTEDWDRRRPDLDAIFSPTVPPLVRLRKYCEFVYKVQADIRCQCGCVLGCPLFSLGAEVSTQEAQLQQKVREILESKRKYLETAIRDAHGEGIIVAPNAAAKARTLFVYYQGLLTQARIENNLEILREALQGTYDVLGIKGAEPTHA